MQTPSQLPDVHTSVNVTPHPEKEACSTDRRRLIQKRLIVAGYVLVTATPGFVSPFIVLYWSTNGLSIEQISYVLAVYNTVAVAANSAWSVAFDHIRDTLSVYRNRLLMACTLMSAFLFAFHLTIVPGSSWLIYMTAYACLGVFQACVISCYDSVVMQSDTVAKESTESSHAQAMAFIGRVKPVSSLSYGLSAFVSGSLSSASPLGIVVIFALATFTSLVFAVLLNWIDLRDTCASSAGDQSEAVTKAMPQNKSQASTGWFCVTWCLVFFALGIGFTLTNTFSFLYWQTTIGTSDWVLGLGTLSTVTFEVVLYPLSSRIIEHRYYTPKLCVLVAIAALSLRLALTPLVTQSWMILLVELLHGLSMALAVISLFDQWNRFIAPAQKTMVISIVFLCMASVAPVLAMLSGSAIYTNLSGSTLFYSGAVFELVCIIVYMFLPAYADALRA